MINIKTINEQYKQCKKITSTLFQYKNKKIKNLKTGEKGGPISAFIYTTPNHKLTEITFSFPEFALACKKTS